MRRGSAGFRRGWLGAACLLAALPALAQSNDEVQSAMQLDFSTPGARSLGLGGAFIAVADDATAAYSNPAGLTQLIAPETSIEVRGWSYTSAFAASGHEPETGVTGIGTDTLGGLDERRITERVAGLSFLSYVHTGDRWAVALYRHQLADFRASLDSQGPYIGSRQNPNRLFPARSQLRLTIANYGLSAAYRLRNDLTLGIGLSYLDFELRSRTDRYLRAERTGDRERDSLTGGFFGPADFLPGNITNTQIQEGDDGAWAASLGLLWRIDGRWSVGAVYRQGPELDFRATFLDGPASERGGTVDPTLGGEGRFHVPDLAGLGLAFRPSDNWVVCLDWDHVRWSELSSGLVNLLRAAQVERGRFVIDDTDELRLGGEYQSLATRLPFTLRLGTWWEPDHKLRYEGASEALAVRFQAGDDQLHAALGFGLVVGRVQLDLAGDWSERVKTISLSAVTRFSRP